jgi:cell division protein FtsB
MKFYRGNPQFLHRTRKRLRWVFWSLPVVLFTYLFVAGEGGYYQLSHRDRQIEAFRLDIEATVHENERLRSEVQLLKKDLVTIERIAREQYGMVKPNETVYMVYPHHPGQRREANP